MAELLFIATMIFVAYVVFVVMGDKKDSPEPVKTEEAKPETPQPVAQQAEVQPDVPAELVKSATPVPAAKPKRSRAAPAKAAAAKTEPAPSTTPAPAPTTSTGDTLKNPKTGEVAKIPASYSFAKRWIKDALVEEGLLDKVYKNNELNDDVNARIQDALQQLKALDKYK